MYNGYIPQTEQHKAKVQMLFRLGNVLICWMLPLATTATPITTSTHPTLCYPSSKIWLLSNIQQTREFKLYHKYNKYHHNSVGLAWAGNTDLSTNSPVSCNIQVFQVTEVMQRPPQAVQEGKTTLCTRQVCANVCICCCIIFEFFF